MNLPEVMAASFASGGTGLLDSVTWAYLGATLLAVATLPQALRLLRTRRVDQFGWAFIALNFGGITLLAARSAVIGEWAFLGANLITATFWGMAAVGKAWWGRPTVLAGRDATTSRGTSREDRPALDRRG